MSFLSHSVEGLVKKGIFPPSTLVKMFDGYALMEWWQFPGLYERLEIYAPYQARALTYREGRLEEDIEFKWERT